MTGVQPRGVQEQTLDRWKTRAYEINQKINRSEKIYTVFNSFFSTLFLGLPALAAYYCRYLPNLVGEDTLSEPLSYGLGAVGAVFSGIGLAVQWAKGKWPFVRIEDLTYRPTVWLPGNIGPVFEGPATKLIPWPILKIPIVKNEEGNLAPAYIAGYNRELDSKDLNEEFRIRSSDGLEGKISSIKYAYYVPNKESAGLFFWNFRGRRQIIDQMVLGEIYKNIQGDAMENAMKINYATDIVEGLNNIKDKGSLASIAGVSILNIRPANIDLDDPSQDILLIRKRAEEQAYETERIATATRDSMLRYYESALIIKNAGSQLLLGEIMLELHDRDNEQQKVTSSKNATVVHIGGGGIPVAPIQPTQPPQQPSGPNLKYHPKEPEENP